MPQQAKAKPGTAGSAGDAAADADIEALTEEEIKFCWMSLVEGGALTANKLQEFMLVVTGERLSGVQAKDLLKYMDANDDGVVGREDFINFISTTRLKDTNAQDFMWTPKRKYREEHGTNKQPQDEDTFTCSLPGSVGHRGSIGDFDTKRGSLEVPGLGAGPEQSRGSLVSTGEVSKIPVGGKTGRKPISKPTRQEAAKLEEEANALFLGPAQSNQELEKTKQSSTAKVDAKFKKQIDASVAKYEQQSWQKFLEMEEGFKETLFAHFAADPNGMEVTEYHRMLLAWHKLARWCMPGNLRAGDSLAALKYILDNERRLQKEAAMAAAAGAPAADAAAAAAPAVDAAAVAAGAPAAEGAEQPVVEDDFALPPDAKLTYKMWTDLMSGKFRPEEHQVKA